MTTPACPRCGHDNPADFTRRPDGDHLVLTETPIQIGMDPSRDDLAANTVTMTATQYVRFALCSTIPRPVKETPVTQHAPDAERIVGVPRHQTRHYGRAVSADRAVVILHSQDCLNTYADLRDCPFSLALDLGVDAAVWVQDVPVILAVENGVLTPRVCMDEPLPPAPESSLPEWDVTTMHSLGGMPTDQRVRAATADDARAQVSADRIIVSVRAVPAAPEPERQENGRTYDAMLRAAYYAGRARGVCEQKAAEHMIVYPMPPTYDEWRASFLPDPEARDTDPRD